MKATTVLFRPLAILLVALAVIVGCERVRPIHEVKNHPIPPTADNLSLDEIQKRIIDAAIETDWVPTPLRAGVMRATISWRAHSGTVQIEFDTMAYSIKHISSVNLLEGTGTSDTRYAAQKVIHRNYVKRVVLLEQAIAKQLIRPSP